MSHLKLKYFVMKPRGNTPGAAAARTAMRVFASEIEQHDPALAAEIKQWVYEEERQLTREAQHVAIEG